MSAIPASTVYVPSKSRERTRALSLGLVNALAYALLFGALVGATWVVSSLLGNVKVEEARRELIVSKRRAREARNAVAVLRRSIDSATSYSAVADWALSNGFRAPDQAVQPSSLQEYVASNR